MSQQSNRRNFLKQAAGVGVAWKAAPAVAAASPAAKMSGRILGANDRIRVACIGCGGRGHYVTNVFFKHGQETNSCEIVAVCDVYQKRANRSKTEYKAEMATLDYREILSRRDIDAVIVATPDHWHARIALEAMDTGKDVYLEKPMCHTIEEVKQLMQTVAETKRIVQVGSQTTSGDQWHKAKKAIAEGMIGKHIMSQGSYHRNSLEGEWNWRIDPDAGPDAKGENYVDWKMWLGPAPKRPWNPDRFFRFRKYWDYSGGIATDLFFHVAAPMNICWGEPQFPAKVVASGGIYGGEAFLKDREVPDTFHLLAEYAQGFSVVLSSSMANSQHIPGLIRGKDASLIMVEHGRFEGFAPYITVRPERAASPAYKERFGVEEIKIPVDNVDTMKAHVGNFLECMRTRKKPTLDVETAARAQVLITMAVQSYRQGKVLYFDEKRFRVTDKPVSA
ncbi:MAG: Gfo/Idh/MocA family oxidoreductase [Bryobacteraceae bacterium]|nr:Gfo/Idh/MocA family oxidoreductase [Bryobacteraceae bacterium]MDW8378952.1 Gfo/Idh/MocA family oxidoreductase [Bryobacterales bacterium]